MNRFVALRKPPDQTVTATISVLTQEHVEQISDVWRAILQATQQPDEGWDWTYKLRLSLNDDRYEAYAIEWGDLIQGVVLLETRWHRSGLPERAPLVYVEYLASAPWNRRPVEDPPYLVGVGQALLLLARQRSVELGYGGRVGLHSLPGAETFYQLNGMADYGHDAEKGGLVYFEYIALRG